MTRSPSRSFPMIDFFRPKKFVRKCGVCFTLLALTTLPNRAHGQQSSKLTTVNYGTITISALHWPFLIAEQEGFLQREGIDFKRVMGGTTTATSQALVAGSTDFAQINLVQHSPQTWLAPTWSRLPAIPWCPFTP